MFIYNANKFYGKNSTTLYWMRLFLAFPEIRHFWIFEKPCTGIRIVLLFHNKEHFSKPSRGTLFENPNNWGVGHMRFWWRNAKGKGSSENGWGRFNWRPKPCLPPVYKCIFHPSNNKKNLTSFRFVIDLSYLIRTRFIWGF